MTRLRPSSASLAALALVTSLALAACRGAGAASIPTSPGASTSPSASSPASPAASQPASVEPSASLPAFACIPSVTIARTTDRAQITDLRVGTHAGYDRVVFEFASGIPDTQVEGVLPPLYADPSGKEVTVAGSSFLKVTMHGASGISPDGVLTYSGPSSFKPGFPRLVELVEGGDFEAVSTWYLGLDGGACFRVLTLDAPSRLVIDIEH